MAQLARPDLARKGSATDYTVSGTAGFADQAGRAGQARQPDGAASYLGIQEIPGWTVVTAALVPVVLVTGWVVAGALQPASYSPMQQTMSVLAGHTGTDPWIMTGALFVVGGCQVATGVGVAGVCRPPGTGAIMDPEHLLLRVRHSHLRCPVRLAPDRDAARR